MKSFQERIPDDQYQRLLKHILEKGQIVKETPQGVGAITCLCPPPLHFNILDNGFPLVTEREINFWKAGIGELLAFIHGARTVEEIAKFSPTAARWWRNWATTEKCQKIAVEEGDLGPASYGAAFHDFPMVGGGTYNQWKNLIEMIRNRPERRTIRITPWIPYLNGWGTSQGAVVSPCHGDVYVRIIDGVLDMGMHQRSADVPVGVPMNIVQYASIMLAICQVTGYTPGKYHHSFWDAHIYTNQTEAVEEMIYRQPKRLPTMTIDPTITDLFDFRTKHFNLSDYNPHPAMNLPVAI